MAPNPRTLLTNTAAAAWDRYASTVYMGGTPEERQWALDLAVKADDLLAVHDQAKAKAKT